MAAIIRSITPAACLVGVVLLGSVIGVSAKVEGSEAFSIAQLQQKHSNTKCSQCTVKGRYAFALQGTVAIIGPLAASGTTTFDGKGLVNITGFAGELDASIKELQNAVAAAPEGEIAAPVRQKLSTPLTEDMPEAVGFIHSSSRRMDALINAILNLSREGRRSLDLRQLDLEQLIKASVDGVRHQIAEASGIVTFATATIARAVFGF